MQFLTIALFTLITGAAAQSGCGFPDGPDCVSLGDNADGVEEFADDKGCCLLPLRCGNEADVVKCTRVAKVVNQNNDLPPDN